MATFCDATASVASPLPCVAWTMSEPSVSVHVPASPAAASIVTTCVTYVFVSTSSVPDGTMLIRDEVNGVERLIVSVAPPVIGSTWVV